MKAITHSAGTRFWTERSVPGSPSWLHFQARFLSRYRFAFSLSAGRRVLDVASGAGYGSYLLATEGRAADVLGVDIAAEAVSHAHATFQAPNLRFALGDGNDLTATCQGPFDLVVSMGTLEHVTKPDRFAREVGALLGDSGVWLVTMLNPAVHDTQDPYHSQEFDLPAFRAYLGKHFRDVVVLGHQVRESGRSKQAANSRRFRGIPVVLKRAARAALGPALTWRLRLRGATLLAPDDYVWTGGGVDTALEFLGVCRQPR